MGFGGGPCGGMKPWKMGFGGGACGGMKPWKMGFSGGPCGGDARAGPCHRRCCSAPPTAD
jgi:hypothetical protein